jgi:hypothetical protein
MHVLYNFVILLFITITPLCAVATAPSHVVDELERLLGARMISGPSRNYVSGSQLFGRETAAQWIRVAFRMWTGNPFHPMGYTYT